MSDSSNRHFVIFTEAVAKVSSERSAFLDSACRGDVDLRLRVEELLRAHDELGDFLRNSPSANQARSPTSPGPQPGDRIDRYRLLEQIGEGGCGIVFVAEQEQPIRRRVALKVIKPGMDTRSIIARFEAERQALALMDHPNIARVFDAGTTETSRPYFVMELVLGLKITDYCDRHSLSTEDRLNLFVQVCQAVQHAHQKGIIHRDLKPSNILVSANSHGAPSLKVIDFGIAKATTGYRLTDKTVFTEFEMLIGTPAYMSPEQAALSNVDVDTRSDIYSLGVLLYELLTGSTPFNAGELLKAGLDEIRREILNQEPVRPSTRLGTMLAADLTTVAQRRQAEAPKLIRTVRGDLDWIAIKALEKDRTRRYQTATGLADDIQHFLAHEPIAAGPPSTFYKLQKSVQRNKMLYAGALGVVLSLAAGLSLAAWLLAKERHARRDADQARKQAEVDKQRAVAEAAKSSQVTRFLQDMLNGVGPSAANGRDTALLREIVDRTAERVTTELANQPAVEASLRSTLGRVYEDLGLYPQAADMFRHELTIRRDLMMADSSEAAVAQGLLGRILLRDQKLEEAAREAEAADALWRKLGQEESLDAATTLETLAMVRWKQVRVTEAETLMRRAHALRLKVLPPDDKQVLDTLNNLGNVLFTARKFADAEELYRQLLEAKQKQYGNEHPSVASALQNLGSCLGESGKFAEGKELLARALAMRRKLLGEQHPDIAASLESLGNNLQRSGSFAEAEKLFRELLVLQRNRFGQQHAVVLRTARIQARSLAAQKKHKEVGLLLNDFLTPEFIRTPESASMLSLRAEALARMGRWRDAAADAARVVEHEPTDHQHYHTLAPLLVAHNDLDAYAKLCREIVTRFSGTTSVSVADRMAKDCLIHPSSGADLSSVAALAETAVTKGKDRSALALYQFCKALAEYRQGHFAAAAEWASKPAASSFPYAAAEACAVLAMAKHHLKEPEAARASLAKANMIFETKLPKPDSGDLGRDWRDWIIVRSLLAEARLLIEGNATVKD
jgi:serine/threonine protein kinase/Tfp pilus assembly protein PilF